MNKSLLTDIDAFRARYGLADYTFGLLAAKNGRLVKRLRDGGRVWPETEKLIRDFIATESDRRANKKRAA